MYKTLQNLGSESSFKHTHGLVGILKFYNESLVIQPLKFWAKLKKKKLQDKERREWVAYSANLAGEASLTSRSSEMGSHFLATLLNPTLHHVQQVHLPKEGDLLGHTHFVTRSLSFHYSQWISQLLTRAPQQLGREFYAVLLELIVTEECGKGNSERDLRVLDLQLGIKALSCISWV